MDVQIHSSLTDRVAASLGQAIAVGEYPPGTTLPTETELAELFGASRTVLREAVKMLTAKGLVDARPRRGTVVKPEIEWNLADPDILSWLLHRRGVLPLIQEFADVRLAIEPAAAALAAANAKPAEIAEMKDAIDRMRESVLGGADPLVADIDFHVAILKGSGNRFFWSLRFMISVALRFSIRVTDPPQKDKHGNVEDHNRVLEAIEAGDAAQAESLMRALLSEAKSLLADAQSRSDASLAEANATSGADPVA